jgi:hypothetical protein
MAGRDRGAWIGVIRAGWALCALVALVLACQGGAEDAGEQACAGLRDHLVALALEPVAAARGADPQAAAEIDRHRRNLTASLADNDGDDCLGRSPRGVACALEASTVEELERCPR